MGLFNKEKDIPSLPPVPTLPDLPRSSSNLRINELPTIPSNGSDEKLNQEIVKSVVSDSSGDKKGDDGLSENFHNSENSFVPSLNIKPFNDRPSTIQQLPSLSDLLPESYLDHLQAPAPHFGKMHGSVVGNAPSFPSIKSGENNSVSVSSGFSIQNKSEPIFVRIDKFQAAKKEFEEIRNKIKEIEYMLRRIKEVKIREDTEIEEWVKDIENLKARLSNIDSHIFNKL